MMNQVEGDVVLDSFILRGTDTIVVSKGSSLTIKNDSSVEGHISDTNDRIRVEAGGILQCDPGGKDVTLTISTRATKNYATMRLAGTSDDHAVLRKKPGSIGTFTVKTPNGEGYSPDSGVRNPITADHADILDLNALQIAAYYPESRLTLRDCRIESQNIQLSFYEGGRFTIEDCWI
jgi:hypothetical protein